MIPSKLKAVILDIDETLTEFVSWIKLTADLGESMSRHSEIYTEYITGKIPLIEAEKLIVENWSNKKAVSIGIINTIIKRWSYRPGAKTVINRLKRKYKLAFISGSIEPFYKLVCEDFGVKERYNMNKFYWNNGVLEKLSYSPDKDEYFQKFLIDNNLKAEECIVVGDGDNDLTLFKSCGYSVLFKKETNSHLEQYCDKVIASFNTLNEILL